MKTRIACNYAVIRFLPYPEAGEFVNVGVVVHSPKTGFFDHRLLPAARISRVHGFFPELQIDHYKDALKNCAAELNRMRGEIGICGNAAQQVAIDPQLGVALFRELVRPRETVIRFSNAGTALADEADEFLCELFDRYVLRMFAKEVEYQEQVMQRRVAQTLRTHKLITRFREAKVGNEDYHVNFPFVYQPRIGLFARAIKPLNLAQADSTKIYDHGTLWVNRIHRLRRMHQAPKQMLFPVHVPAAGEKKRRAACDEICAELKNLGVLIVPENDDGQIVRFAEAAREESGGTIRLAGS